MATHKEYLKFVLDQLSPLEGVTYRPMMGEYLLYYGGKLVGGVYDDRLLLKPAKSALRLISDCGRELPSEIPYEGAKPMLLADIDDAEHTANIIRAIADEVGKRRK
jgi:TfoX/Sxy family transcriptional regulator of competence genes